MELFGSSSDEERSETDDVILFLTEFGKGRERGHF